MKNKVLMYCFALFALAYSCKEEPQSEIKMVSPEEMQSLLELEDIQLVDVRTPAEHKSGYIEHAQNIDLTSPTFDEDIIKLDKTKPVVVYCKSGGRSAKCSKKLKEAGFVKIYDLEGGLEKWKFKGLEIKTIE
ncbi:rhodanese-like domain-containing protein [Psychroserpens algicola]|uniref:Rhodanese-like domain-containing protein n=1 Tax=Psychroserpens algicola TaxID=1719034 RepID=A0ABT0H708_9FLAO|nr:rhodanese-like domain-containing protein [Psychroserpens algicola]MCK8480167.1 rhodanese-like domain-containing protein [Psychroserpens algicola]